VELPDLPEDLYEHLKEDIGLRGIIVPVIVDAESGETLDGRIRLRIAAELNIRDVPTIYLSRLSERDRADIRTSTNLYRRQLSRKQVNAVLDYALRRTPGASDGAIAGRVGVDHKTVGKVRARLVSGREIPDLGTRAGRDGKSYPAAKPSVYASSKAQGTIVSRHLAELGDDAPPGHLSPRDLRQMLGEKQRAGQDQSARPLPRSIRIKCCDFREVGIEPGSVALVYADGPWLSDWKESRPDFAREIYTALKKGGFVAAYVGQFYLLDWLNTFVTEGFTYRWMIACQNAGDGGSIRQRGSIRTAWRPLALLQKPGAAFKTPQLLMDVMRTQTRDKDHHVWEQPLSEAIEIIRCLSVPGDLIADLTLGSGTSAVAAALVGGRTFVGCDSDAACCRLARRRVFDALKAAAPPARAGEA